MSDMNIRPASRSGARYWLIGLYPAFLLSCFPAFAEIANSAHDFSEATWSGNEICVICHAPHNADTVIFNAPLWNHQVTSATFDVYNSTSLDATIGQPDGLSKLCLGCHDGTVALDSFGGMTGSTIIDDPLGTDLSNDHPISFIYDDALASTDGSLFNPTSTTTVLGGTIQTDLLSNGDKVECSACHDVHNADGLVHLLRIDNEGSALCLTCHDK